MKRCIYSIYVPLKNYRNKFSPFERYYSRIIEAHKAYANSINVDYEINFNKFSVEGELEYEYSGVDYETAITDFVNMLDINNKHDVIQYTVDLYKSCKE